MTRKEAIREFKERVTSRGIFTIRCAATGGLWIGSSRNLDAAKNGYWFGLGTGNHQDKSLQAAWKAHGDNAFTYEVLETLDDDVHALELNDLLKTKRAEWIAKLGGEKLL